MARTRTQHIPRPRTAAACHWGRLGLTIAATLLVVSVRAQEAASAPRLTLPVALSWRFTATYDTNNPSAPAVLGDTVYFACGDRVYALDLETGSQKWRFPQDAPLSTRIRTTPAISGDILYFGADDGKLYALNTATGKGTWLFDTRSSVGSSPAIADGIVYFGSADGRVFAIDTRTGAEVTQWKGGFKAQDEITGAPAVANGIVYVLSLDQVLHAIGAATGKERATVRLGGSVLKMSPVAQGDYLFVASGALLRCFLGRNLTMRWTQMLTNDIIVTPAASETGVYAVTADNTVVAFEPRTGKPKWRINPKLDYDVLAAPTLVGNLLFVGTVQGGLYAIDTETGKVKWLYQTQPSSSTDEAIATWTNIAARPVVVGDRLLVLSDDGSLSCFRSNEVDTTPPTVKISEPAAGAVINGVPPIHFEAKITDDGSGVNPASIRLLIDGEGVVRRPEGKENEDQPGFVFDLLRATLEYDTPEPRTASLVRPMPDGRHTATVVATDWAGNQVSKSWTFTIDNSVAKLARKKRTSETGTFGPGGRAGGMGGPGGRGGRGGRSGGSRGGGGGAGDAGG